MLPMRGQNATTLSLEAGGLSSKGLLLSQQLLEDSKRPQKKAPTAHLLEDQNTRLLQRIATHDEAHPDFTELMSDDYRAYLEDHDVPYEVGRDNYLANYRAFAEANPDHPLHPVSVVADVHENNTTASVWQLSKVVGHPKGVQRESVTVASWRRKAGKRQVYKQTGIRGAGWCLVDACITEKHKRVAK